MTEEREERLRTTLIRAAFIAEHLMQMIPRQTWRDSGAFAQGVYEGDIHEADTRAEIEKWKRIANDIETEEDERDL